MLHFKWDIHMIYYYYHYCYYYYLLFTILYRRYHLYANADRRQMHEWMNHRSGWSGCMNGMNCWRYAAIFTLATKSVTARMHRLCSIRNLWLIWILSRNEYIHLNMHINDINDINNNCHFYYYHYVCHECLCVYTIQYIQSKACCLACVPLKGNAVFANWSRNSTFYTWMQRVKGHAARGREKENSTL